MLDQLLNGVLPVFGIGALGYVFGLRGTFDFNMAMALNKFVMFVAMPALGFQLLANAPLAEFNFAMLGGYFVTEVVMYAVGFLIARRVFKTDVLNMDVSKSALSLSGTTKCQHNRRKPKCFPHCRSNRRLTCQRWTDFSYELSDGDAKGIVAVEHRDADMYLGDLPIEVSRYEAVPARKLAIMKARMSADNTELHQTQAQQDELHQIGASEVISKPFDPMSLGDQINSIIGK